MTAVRDPVRLSRDDAEFLAATLVGRDAVSHLRPQLAAVSEAMARREPPGQVERLAARVAAETWRAGLEAVAEHGLDGLECEARRLLSLVERARRELAQPPSGNRLAQHLVLCEGVRTVREAEQLYDELCGIEAELRELPTERRGSFAVRSAGRILAWRWTVPRNELVEAACRVARRLGEQPDLELARPAAQALASAVATEARRRVARRAAHDLRRTAVRQRLFHEQLDLLLIEGMPVDPDDDELWLATVMGGLELC